MVSLISLPEEILCRIALQVTDRYDLKSLRLSCKKLHPWATEALFSSVYLFPVDESLARYNKIRNDAVLSKLVRHIELSTRHGEEGPGFITAELDDGILDAMASFITFPSPNLNTATLRFSPWASAGDDGRLTWPENYEFRRPVFQKFMTALAADGANIKDLCIDNLQNINDEAFMRTDAVRKALARLSALRLHIATELLLGGEPESCLELREYV